MRARKPGSTPSRLAAIVGALLIAAAPAGAQDAAPAAKPDKTKFVSPLDTLLATRLWADVGTTPDFVRESRPDPGSLSYQPLNGTDPVRPKLRDGANVQALRAELDHDRISNNGKLPAAKMPAAKSPTKPSAHAGKAAASKATSAQ